MLVRNAFPNCKDSSTFSAMKAVSLINKIIWNKELLTRFQMRLWEQGHIYV
jgi:hypothetical protein